MSHRMPPKFISSAVQMLVDCHISSTIQPEMLRAARLGKSDEVLIKELWAMIKTLHAAQGIATCPHAVHPQLIVNSCTKSSHVLLLLFTWLATKQCSWADYTCRQLLHSFNSSLVDDFHFFRSTVPQRVLPNAQQYTDRIDLTSINAIVREYSRLVHMLRKFQQLDMSRLRISSGILELLVTLQECGPPSTDADSTTSDCLENLQSTVAFNSNQIIRISDNLCRGAVLYAPLVNSSTSMSGIETMKAAGRRAQEVVNGKNIDDVDEAAFLKWVSGSITHTPYSAVVNKDDETNGFTHSNISEFTATAAANERELEEQINRSVPILAALEGKALQIILDERSAMSEAELQKIFDSVDAQLVQRDGLTVEAIDDFISELFVDVDEAADGATASSNSMYTEWCREYDLPIDATCSSFDDFASVQNDLLADDLAKYFEALDSSNCYRANDDSFTAFGADDSEFRHLQQCCGLLPADMVETLIELRGIHKHTLQRTAAACSKFCPYEIAWKPAS